MLAKPLLVLRESPRLVPERIRDHDAGIRMLIRPSLVYGVPCALIALYFYHAEIAPFIDPPRPELTFWILASPFVLPVCFIAIRIVLSVPRFRGVWRTTWALWPKGLVVSQSPSGSRVIPWRDVTAVAVEPHGDNEISVRLTLAPQLQRPGSERILVCLRNELPCDIDSLRERIAALL